MKIACEEDVKNGNEKSMLAQQFVANSMIKSAYQFVSKMREMKKVEPLTKSRRGQIVVASAPTRDERERLLMDHFESVDRLGKVLYSKKQEQKHNLRQRMNARRRCQMETKAN